MSMKRILFLMVLWGYSIVSVSAQQIQINETFETVENVARAGLYTLIGLDTRTVGKAWEKHLRTYGKLTSNKGIYTVPLANISDLSSGTVSVFSKVQSTAAGTKVWWAIDMAGVYAASLSNHEAFKAASKILHDFAADCYRHDISAQVQEAEEAYFSATRFHEREVKHGEKLLRDLLRNKEEKLRLEEALKKNEETLEQLKKSIEMNKSAQAEAARESDKMKNAIEVVKGKMNGIQ
jgi:hypothetical protein